MEDKQLADRNLPASIIIDGSQLILSGAWTKHGLTNLQNSLPAMTLPSLEQIDCSGSAVSKMDSIGAWLLNQLFSRLRDQGTHIRLMDFSVEQHDLLKLIDRYVQLPKPPAEKTASLLQHLGKSLLDGLSQLNDFLQFSGEIFVAACCWVAKPQRIRWRSLWAGVQSTGYYAVPIIALLTFLIGVVLAYQMGLQLENYGANIFVVDLLGLALLREFGPLLTAIIVAGRSGSAFTAQIGTMRLNEEVAALRTMGLPPIELLVLPRVCALIIVLPLLTIMADIFGVFGGMLMSKAQLDVSFADFLQRFVQVIDVDNLIVGLIKTPVFAMLIAGVGCFQGFQVRNSAESVGAHTTKSVVQGIFMIIVADAAFSVLYGSLGI